METYHIAVSAGDGIGEELLRQAKKLFAALEQRDSVRFALTEVTTCGPAADAWGTAFRKEDLETVKQCRAILFGNIGDPKRVSAEGKLSSVYALTSARRAFQVCTSSRPVRIFPATAELSPLKPSITEKGMDILIVRDLMGGMIAGERHRWHGAGGEEASDLEYYTEEMIRHSAVFAFRAAKRRRQVLTSVDKANVLYSSKLWRQTVMEIGKEYPEVSLNHHYVDNAAMELLVEPSVFDVVLASNVFGDILSDEIAQISGTPWMFGSAELAVDGRGVYTPNQLHHPHSSEWAGKGIVNPCGVLDAASLMLRYSCGRGDLADTVDAAIRKVLDRGLFTAEAVPQGGTVVTTNELGDAVADAVRFT